MKLDKLQKTLAELKLELATLGSQDEAAKAHINELIEKLEHHINETPEPTNRIALQENFASTIERFEAEHPRITLILNQIMNTISGSGI